MFKKKTAMKKTYLNPTTTVVKIELTKMIATSNPEGFSGTLGSTGTSGNNGLSRRNSSLWDDDEE